jgi:Tubulin like
MNILVLGLGGTGVRVCQRLRMLATEDAASGLAVLAIDQAPLRRDDCRDGELATLTSEEMLSLPGEASRVLLRHVAGWQPYLDWLPERPEMAAVDEMAPEGAGGQRWLGRLAFFAKDQEIRRAVRDALARLASRKGSVDCVVLVAALGGGTGSGLLVDMTLLLEALARDVTRIAYLLLPSVSAAAGDVERANAYAALQEAFLLKTRRVGFHARYPTLGMRDLHGSSIQAWHRVFLAAINDTRANPYADAIEHMALGLSVLARPAAHDLIVGSSQRWVEIAGQDGDRYDDFCFSACSAAREVDVNAGWSRATSFRGEPRGGGSAAASAVSDAQSGATQADQPAAKVGVEDWAPGFVSEFGGEADEAAHQLIVAVRDYLEELVERSRHNGDQGTTESDLLRLECAMAKVLGDLEMPDPKPRLWQRILIGLRLRAKPVPRSEKPAKLEDLPGFAHAIEWLQAEILRHPDRGGDAGRRLVDRWRNSESARIKEEDDELARLVSAWKLELTANALHPGRLHHEKERCAHLDAIVQQPAFRRSLRDKIVKYVQLKVGGPGAGVDEPAGGSASRADSAVDAPAAEGHEVQQKDAATPPAVYPATAAQVHEEARPGGWSQPAVPEWQERIDRLVAGLDRTLFEPTVSSSRRRTFAVALIPETLWREPGCEALSGHLRAVLASPACCAPVPDDEMAILLWDLNHSPCEIRGYGALRSAYREQRNRQRFHIDPQYLSASHDDPCERLAQRLPAVCGNPDCDADISTTQVAVRCCPGCGRPIRSRCGNQGCTATDLHLRPDGQDLSCPACKGFNHGAWWLCERHGKVPVWVPIDKLSCPKCIVRHQEDPGRYPLATVSWRPHDRLCRQCPNCLRLSESDLDRPVFHLPHELLRYYDNGVNGHDRAKVAALAARHRMPDGYRCPVCRTPLIPVHPAKVACSPPPATIYPPVQCPTDI